MLMQVVCLSISLYISQAVKQLLELPLNLNIVSPAHTPNWDLVSDVVNSCSRIYRSPKQCRNRYENVIIPREEGKVTMTHSLSFAVVNSRLLLFHTPSFFQLVYEANPKKKTKSIYKVLPPLLRNPKAREFLAQFLP